MLILSKKYIYIKQKSSKNCGGVPSKHSFCLDFFIISLVWFQSLFQVLAFTLYKMWRQSKSNYEIISKWNVDKALAEWAFE